MRFSKLSLLVAWLAATVAAGVPRTSAGHPATPRSGAVDVVHGVVVPDPYRWLESPDAPETVAWVSGQEATLTRFLAASPAAPVIRRHVDSLVAYETVSVPQRGGRRYVFSKAPADRSANVGRIYVADAPDAAGTLAVDVQAENGATASLGTFAASPDGRYVAYVAHDGGSAWGGLRIHNLATGVTERLAHPGVHRMSRLQWTPDSQDVFYTIFDRKADPQAPVGQQSLRRHRIDGRPGRDEVVPLGTDDPSRLVTVRVTDDGRFAIIATQVGTDQRTSIALLDLRVPGARPEALVQRGDAAFTWLGSLGRRHFFYTDLDAPKGQVIEMDLLEPGRSEWRTVVPEQVEAIAARDQTGGNALGMFGDRLLLMYLRDGRPFLRIFTAGGALAHSIELPAAGSVWGGFTGRQSSPEVFFQFLGMADPSTILRLDVVTGTLHTVRRAAIPFDSSRYVVAQDFYRSPDGTRIPIYVVHRRGLARDGRNPTLLYGYGALGWVSFIWYQPHVLAWLEMGGVYAQPAIRGGGEYGKSWHEAALRAKKQTAVDDYLAAADWLVRERYTSTDRLVATGGSLSAPLAAAALAQRPSQFGAAVIDRPVSDLVRYERFTGAAFWTPEFGSVANPQDFAFLHRFSPYHEALKGTCLPPTIVMVGERDQTAPPLHGYKLVAARQAAASCDAPVLLKLMRGAAHDFGKTPGQQADSFAAELTFLAQILQLEPARAARGLAALAPRR